MTEQIIAMCQALNFILATGEHGPNCGAFDLDEEGRNCVCTCGLRKTIDTLRTAIEQAGKHEPHSWYSAEHDEWMTDKTRKEHEELNSYTHKVGGFDLPLYTTPPAAQRQWVGLTDEEIKNCVGGMFRSGDPWLRFARAIEAKLRERNGGQA